MTLHSAKGLEFPNVFIIAVEQEVLPHIRSMDDPAQVEEERRLFFVGITRAKDRLQISLANRRGFKNNTSVPSPFLIELPRLEMELVDLTEQPYGFDEDGFGDFDDFQGGSEEEHEYDLDDEGDDEVGSVDFDVDSFGDEHQGEAIDLEPEIIDGRWGNSNKSKDKRTKESKPVSIPDDLMRRLNQVAPHAQQYPAEKRCGHRTDLDQIGSRCQFVSRNKLWSNTRLMVTVLLYRLTEMEPNDELLCDSSPVIERHLFWQARP